MNTSAKLDFFSVVNLARRPSFLGGAKGALKSKTFINFLFKYTKVEKTAFNNQWCMVALMKYAKNLSAKFSANVDAKRSFLNS